MEPGRCALTTIHFPERRSFTGDDTTAEPLPAPLQKLAATAKALEDRSTHRTTDSDDAHRPAATISGSLHDRNDSLQSHEIRSQHSSKAAQCGAKEKGADETIVQFHAAGHDPVWILLYAVKVRLAQAQLAGNQICRRWQVASESQDYCVPDGQLL